MIFFYDEFIRKCNTKREQFAGDDARFDASVRCLFFMLSESRRESIAKDLRLDERPVAARIRQAFGWAESEATA